MLKRRSLTLQPIKTLVVSKQKKHQALDKTLETALKISNEAPLLSSEQSDSIEEPTKESRSTEEPDKESKPTKSEDPSKLTSSDSAVPAPPKSPPKPLSRKKSISTSPNHRPKVLRKSKSLDDPYTKIDRSNDAPRRAGRRKSGDGSLPPHRGSLKARYSGDELYPAMKPTQRNGSRKPSRLETDLVFDAKQKVSQTRPVKNRLNSKEWMEINAKSNHSTESGVSSLGMGSNQSISSEEPEQQQPIICFPRRRRLTVCSLPSVDTALLGMVVLASPTSSPTNSGSSCTINSNDGAPRRPVRRRSLSPAKR